MEHDEENVFVSRGSWSLLLKSVKAGSAISSLRSQASSGIPITSTVRDHTQSMAVPNSYTPVAIHGTSGLRRGKKEA